MEGGRPLKWVAVVLAALLAVGWTWGKKQEAEPAPEAEAELAVSQPVEASSVTGEGPEEAEQEPVDESVPGTPGEPGEPRPDAGPADGEVVDSVKRLAEALRALDAVAIPAETQE